MKHQQISDADRVGVLCRGNDGRLHAEVNAGRLAELKPHLTADEIASALVKAAGEMELAETRTW